MIALVACICVLTSGGSSAAQSNPREVRVAVRPLEPFVVRAADGSYSGFSIDLWSYIAAKNNYRTTYVEVRNVTEQLDAVRAGRADVAITAISITAEREESVDFSVPMFNSGLQIAVPASASRETGGLLSALATRSVRLILLTILVSIIFAALVVWLIERRDNPDFAHTGVKGVFEGLWWAVVTLLTVGYGDRVTRTSAGRVFSMMFMLFGVLLVASFTAAFTAALTLHTIETDIPSANDLRGHKVVTLAGTTAASYLKERNIPFDVVGSVDEMIGRVERSEADAAVYDAPVLTYAVKRGHAIHLVGGPITREYYGVAMAQDSDLQDPIDMALLDAYQDGAYSRYYTAWFED